MTHIYRAQRQKGGRKRYSPRERPRNISRCRRAIFDNLVAREIRMRRHSSGLAGRCVTAWQISMNGWNPRSRGGADRWQSFPCFHSGQMPTLATPHTYQRSNTVHICSCSLRPWRDEDCRLPMDEDYLCRITRLNRQQWRRNAPTLLAFWYDDDGFLYQKRLLHEREQVERRTQKAKDAAKARWRKSMNSDDAEASSEECPDDATNSIPISIPISKNKNSDRQDLDAASDSGAYLLKSETIENAKKIAVGYDIYFLESKWKEWTGDKTLRDPDAAFLAFVRTHVKKNPL